MLLDVRGLASFTDFLVVASGTSDRQVRSIGEHVEKQVTLGKGPRLVGREGYEQGNWVLVDFGEVVVHLFNDTDRASFDLENLWSEAPRLRWDPLNPPADLFTTQSLAAAKKARKAKAEPREVVRAVAGGARRRKAAH